MEILVLDELWWFDDCEVFSVVSIGGVVDGLEEVCEECFCGDVGFVSVAGGVWVVEPESVDGEWSDFHGWPGGFVGVYTADGHPVTVASIGGDGDGDVHGVSGFGPVGFVVFIVVVEGVVDPDADAFEDGEGGVVVGWAEPVSVFPFWCTGYFVVESGLHFTGVDVVALLVEGFEEEGLVVVEERWSLGVGGAVPEDVVEHHLCGGCSGHLVDGVFWGVGCGVVGVVFEVSIMNIENQVNYDRF